MQAAFLGGEARVGRRNAMKTGGYPMDLGFAGARQAGGVAVAVVGEQVLFGKAVHPGFDVVVDDLRIVAFVAVQMAGQGFDMQGETAPVRQAFANKKQSGFARVCPPASW